MITGSYTYSTGLFTVAQNSDNSLTPASIITDNAYFVCERIKAGRKGINVMFSIPIALKILFLSSIREYSNNAISISTFTGNGFTNENGKPLFIIPPNENINIIAYNLDGNPHELFFELEGYFADADGLRNAGNQAFTKTLVNTIL